MITEPTVLILGAGASAPYGFPTGWDLLVEISDDLLAANQSQLRKALEYFAFRSQNVDEFGEALRPSQRPSVDAFLETREKFDRLGKLAIACALIPREKEECLYSGERREWYGYLFEQMGIGEVDFGSNRLSIVTFNYDRSFEHSLFLAIKSSYGLNDERAAKKLQAIPIIHVYGQLGQLPYLGEHACRPYSPGVDWRFLEQHGADAIKIMRKGSELSQEFCRTRELVQEATHVYFLGFAYHEMNVKRLGVDDWPQEFVYGSAYGLMGAERGRAQSLFRHGMLQLGQEHEKTLEFLRTRVPFA